MSDLLCRDLNFPEKLTDLIMSCATSPSYSLLINGIPQGNFDGKRGLRQGDPISPYLFVLCMEILSRKLKALSEEKDFRFHPSCKRLGLVHLAFADDFFIFCKATVKSVKLVKKCLEEFSQASGFHASNEKSECYIVGASERVADDNVEVMGFKSGQFPIKYLGCPLQTRKVCISEYSFLLNKVERTVNCWSNRALSYAGRLQLIKFVIVGIMSF